LPGAEHAHHVDAEVPPGDQERLVGPEHEAERHDVLGRLHGRSNGGREIRDPHRKRVEVQPLDRGVQPAGPELHVLGDRCAQHRMVERPAIEAL